MSESKINNNNYYNLDSNVHEKKVKLCNNISYLCSTMSNSYMISY